MGKSAKRVASPASFEALPPYIEASSDIQLPGPAPSTVSSLPSRCFAKSVPSPFVGLKAASSRISSKLQRDAPLWERERPLEDSATSSKPGKVFKDAQANVPPGVNLVRAPYEFRRKNSSIIRDFLVFKGDPTDTYLPDMRLRTKNALLHSAVYISAQEWGRPVSIHARTKNSDLILGIHTLQADQAVCVRGSTKNGRSRVFLPRDFKGLLAVSTKNGKCTLSADLKKNAVRVPSRYKEMLENKELFMHCSSSDSVVSDVPNELSNGVDVWYEINGNGPSAATVDTKNGNVWVGYVQEEEEINCWASCSIM